MIGFLIMGIIALIFAALYLLAPKVVVKADDFLKRSLFEGKMTKWTFVHSKLTGSFFLAATIILFIAWRMTK